VKTSNPYAPPKQPQQVLPAEPRETRFLIAALAMMALAFYAIPYVWIVVRFAAWTVKLDWRFWVYTLLASFFATLVETRMPSNWQRWLLPFALFPCLLATSLILYAMVLDFQTFVITVPMLPPIVHGILFTFVIWVYFFAACKRSRLLRKHEPLSSEV